MEQDQLIPAARLSSPAAPAGRHRGARWWPEVSILLLAAALRLTWLWHARALWQPQHFDEASNAAIAYARTGVIADAFFPGQGPTAHLMPLPILVAGSIHRLLGVESAAANLALVAWALAQTLAGFWLARCVFTALGQDHRTARAGLLALALLPVSVPQEVGDFRYWEGGLAAALASLNLLWLLALDRRPTWNWPTLVGVAGLSALTFFVSPPAGLAVDLCWAVVAFRRLPAQRILGFALLSAAALALLVGPWAIRNERQLGHRILLRDDLGLEIALANHEGALSDRAPLDTYRARLFALHPHAAGPGLAAMKAAGGEYDYAQALSATTQAWIAEHPADFVRLLLRHYRQFYLPDRWAYGTQRWDDPQALRASMAQGVALLGALGLLWSLIRRRRGYGWIAIYCLAAGAVYAIVQPVPRYSYIIFAMQVLLAAGLLADLRHLRLRKP